MAKQGGAAIVVSVTEEMDELPVVIGELKAALGATAIALSQYSPNKTATEILYHDDCVPDGGTLACLIARTSRPRPSINRFSWTSCTLPNAYWDVLSFAVQGVPGHAQLTINAFFDQPGADHRAAAEANCLLQCPSAVGYLRLWQLNRVRARQSRALEEALSLSNTGIILINRANQITFTNAVADKLLIDGKSIRRNNNGTLSATKIAESVRLQVALTHVIEARLDKADCTAPIMSLRQNNGEALILSVLPAMHTGSESTDIGAIIYIHDPFVNTDRLMLPLCRLFGLSPTETRLASLLVAGTPLPECAVVMRVAQQTARGYLKQLFQKTATRRQVDLVRLMLTSLMHINPSIEVEAI